MYNVILLPLAQSDIKNAARWYEAHQKGLGKHFTHEVRTKVAFIKLFPTASPIKYLHIRTALTRVFPFMLHYWIDEPQKSIVISAVLHTSLNPEVGINRV